MTWPSTTSFRSSGGAAGTAAAAGSAWLGTAGPIVRAGSTLPVGLAIRSFTIPVAGTFLISMLWGGLVTAVPTYTLGGTLSVEKLLADNTTGDVDAVSSDFSVSIILVNVTSSGTGSANTFTITGGLTNLASGSADIIISQISTGLLDLERGAQEEETQDRRIERLERMVRELCVVVDDDEKTSVKGKDVKPPSTLVKSSPSRFFG